MRAGVCAQRSTARSARASSSLLTIHRRQHDRMQAGAGRTWGWAPRGSPWNHDLKKLHPLRRQPRPPHVTSVDLSRVALPRRPHVSPFLSVEVERCGRSATHAWGREFGGKSSREVSHPPVIPTHARVMVTTSSLRQGIGPITPCLARDCKARCPFTFASGVSDWQHPSVEEAPRVVVSLARLSAATDCQLFAHQISTQNLIRVGEIRFRFTSQKQTSTATFEFCTGLANSRGVARRLGAYRRIGAFEGGACS